MRTAWSGFDARPDRSRSTRPASYTMCIASFPGVKRPGRGADHPPHSNAEVANGLVLFFRLHTRVMKWPLPLAKCVNDFSSGSGSDLHYIVLTHRNILSITCSTILISVLYAFTKLVGESEVHKSYVAVAYCVQYIFTIVRHIFGVYPACGLGVGICLIL